MHQRILSRLFALLLAAFAIPTIAAPLAPPTCWVVSGATGYTMGTTTAGRYAAWWCPSEWSWSQVLLISKAGYTLIHPTIPPGASAASAAEAYWNANVAFNCAVPSTNDPAALSLCDAAYNASLDTMPLSRFIVSPYSGATYRATYPTTAAIGGTRSTTSNGRIPIVTNAAPTPCLCLTGRVVETSATGIKTTYCAVAASAPQTVANCRMR